MADATPEPSTRRRSGDPGASKWSCPTTSSSEAGRIRTASGAPADTPRSWSVVCGAPGRSNRPSDTASGIPRRSRQVRRPPGPQPSNPRASATYLLSSGLPSSVRVPTELNPTARTDMSQPPEYPGTPAEPHRRKPEPSGLPTTARLRRPTARLRNPAAGYGPPPGYGTASRAARATSWRLPAARLRRTASTAARPAARLRRTPGRLPAQPGYGGQPSRVQFNIGDAISWSWNKVHPERGGVHRCPSCLRGGARRHQRPDHRSSVPSMSSQHRASDAPTPCGSTIELRRPASMGHRGHRIVGPSCCSVATSSKPHS